MRNKNNDLEIKYRRRDCAQCVARNTKFLFANGLRAGFQRRPVKNSFEVVEIEMPGSLRLPLSFTGVISHGVSTRQLRSRGPENLRIQLVGIRMTESEDLSENLFANARSFAHSSRRRRRTGCRWIARENSFAAREILRRSARERTSPRAHIYYPLRFPRFARTTASGLCPVGLCLPGISRLLRLRRQRAPTSVVVAAGSSVIRLLSSTYYLTFHALGDLRRSRLIVVRSRPAVSPPSRVATRYPRV